MKNTNTRFGSWRHIGVRLSLVLLLLMIASAALPASAAPGDGNGKKHGHEVNPGSPEPPIIPAKSPPRPSKPIQGKPVDTAMVGTHVVDPIGLKVLVIASDGKESGVPGIKAFLDQIGVPYDMYRVVDPATNTKTPLVRDRLWDGGVNGYYQGVILASDSLAYIDPTTGYVPSAFTPDEWKILWTFESTFGIRQVTFNTTGFGPEAFGLNWPAWDDTTHRLGWQQTAAAPVKATLTAAGQAAMPYLNGSYAIPFAGADVVLATAAAGVTTLLQTTNGYAMMSTYKNPVDFRENLAITADGNATLQHSLLLSYGLINWVTKGQFLGERHVYMNAQPDDLCIDDNMWNTTTRTDTSGNTFRMSGSDFNAAITWQNSVRKSATTSQFMLEWPFVGEGCAAGSYLNDTLTAAIKLNQKNFMWINHTWDHSNLNYPAAPEDWGDNTNGYFATNGFVKNELTKNDAAAKNPKSNPYLALNKYNKDAMVQPDISGLYNPYFYQAAYAFGIRYIISDTSRKPPQYLDDWNNPSPNAGYYVVAKFVTDGNGNQVLNPDGSPQVQITRSQTPLPAPALLVIPRRPTNLFYNLRTPAEWVSEYNCFYSKASAQTLPACANGAFLFWDNDLNYSQILDQESKFMLQYLLTWDIDPLMFHQPNVGQYSSGKSLLSDLINTTLGKYNSMYKLPILTVSQHDLGIRTANRMAYNQSGVTALLYPCGKVTNPNITITTVNAARIPITGVSFIGAALKETYGGQNISYVDLPAGGTVSIPISCP